MKSGGSGVSDCYGVKGKDLFYFIFYPISSLSECSDSARRVKRSRQQCRLLAVCVFTVLPIICCRPVTMGYGDDHGKIKAAMRSLQRNEDESDDAQLLPRVSLEKLYEQLMAMAS